MTTRSSSAPRQKNPQRRSATPATYAFVIFVVLAMCRLLIFRPELHVNSSTRQQVTVRNVIDGDTIDLTDGRRVRLLGIDAPEAGFFGKKAEPWSQESTQWLRDRIEGHAVTLRIDESEKDKYGRTLAWIYDSDNILINQQILAEGYAKLLADFGLPLELEPALREAESEARVQRLGLWGLTQK
jgi:endonuclease YncB( thermonuclease family)